MTQMAILTDTTKCIGCGECVIACKKENNLEPEKPRRWQIGDGLSSRNWCSVVLREENVFVRKQCRHCIDPACMSVCPVHAFSRTANGAVIYDPGKCIGCRFCMMACPYGIPRYDWDKSVPYVKKCDMCFERQAQGKQPACVEACLEKATIFGPRDELIKEARARIKNSPAKYIDHIWGEEEVGGTSVLYISNIDLDFLHYGQPVGTKPLPKLTEPAMKAVPYAFGGMGAAMAGLYWIIGRRNKLQRENKEARRNEDG